MLPAVELPLPMVLGTLGGTAEHWAQYGRARRDAWAKVGHPADAAEAAVAVHGFVAESIGKPRRPTSSTSSGCSRRVRRRSAARRGVPPGRATDLERGGMVFAGGPNEADRILHLHEVVRHLPSDASSRLR